MSDENIEAEAGESVPPVSEIDKLEEFLSNWLKNYNVFCWLSLAILNKTVFRQALEVIRTDIRRDATYVLNVIRKSASPESRSETPDEENKKSFRLMDPMRMREFVDRWFRGGGTVNDIRILAKNPLLTQKFLAIMTGDADGFPYHIDGDTKPKFDERWVGYIVRHRRQGLHVWRPGLVELIDVSEHFHDNIPPRLLLRDARVIVPDVRRLANASFWEFYHRQWGKMPKDWQHFKRILFLGSLIRKPNPWKKERWMKVVPMFGKFTFGEFSHDDRLFPQRARLGEYFHPGDAIAVLDGKMFL
jgi:hypothetical protein